MPTQPTLHSHQPVRDQHANGNFPALRSGLHVFTDEVSKAIICYSISLSSEHPSETASQKRGAASRQEAPHV